MDTLHPARAGTPVAKPVTGTAARDRPLLLVVGGDGSLRSRLVARLPEFQVQLEAIDEAGRACAPDLVLAALPLDVEGRRVLSVLRSTSHPPVVGLVASKDEPLLRLLAPELDDVVVRVHDDDVPVDLEARLLARAASQDGGTPASAMIVAAGVNEVTDVATPLAAAPASALVLDDIEMLGETTIGSLAPRDAPLPAPDLADLLDEAVIELDANCRVVAANLAACAMADLSRAGILGRTCAEVLPEDEACGAEPCVARRARNEKREVRVERQRGNRVLQVTAVPRDGGLALYREVDVSGTRQLERKLAKSLDSLEAANAELVARASCLERVVQASTDLKSATTREELAERVLRVLADLPGFSLVAVGLQDEDQGSTQMSGIARLPGNLVVPLGRRMVLLDILNLSPDRKRVSNSQVVQGLCISIHGSPDTWGPRTAQGEWDLAEVFDGSAVALTPLRASSRAHGFLLVKAGAQAQEIDGESLRVVEILANLAAVAFDNLRLQEAERRRTALMGMVSRLGRALIDVHDPDTVLALASEAMRSVLEGALVSTERVRESPDSWTVGGLLAGPLVLKALPDSLASPTCISPVESQLLVPVRVGDRVRAVITATSSSKSAFDDLDLSAVELYAKVVAKAQANADAFQDEQKSLERLRLVADIGRIAGSSLDMDEVLARSLAHLCQHGAYEMSAVALLDPERSKLVLRAQASSTGARVVDGLSTRLSQGISGTVAATGQAMLVPDVTKEPCYLEVDPSVRSELCVPLRALGGVVGVLDVESREPSAFDEGDLAALTSIADHLAAALHNGRLFRQVTDKNRELRESEKNKTEFLSIVAHDLRTPLTSIRSAAELVLMYRDEPQEVTEEFVRSIRDESARLGRLVDDFLAHSRMEAGILDYEVVEVDLPALLEHFCRVFDGPASQKKIVMELSVPSDLPVLLADSERLSQVVANLLSNATKYTPEGGRIRVSACAIPARPGQVLGRVRVDVEDSGPGIGESDRERIFEKFVRLDGATGGGAGLGLPIARAIVEHLGGRLWLDSEPGRGAMFSFVLPARLR